MSNCRATAFIMMSLSLLGVIPAQAQCQSTKGKVARSIDATLVDVGTEVGEQRRKFLMFETPLQVTTDGAPNAIGPILGSGLNNLCNSIVAYKVNERGDRINILGCSDTVSAFTSYRENDWHEPPNIDIVWQNGLVARDDNGREVPCQFKDGPYANYYATKTNLKNGLGDDAGECSAADQIDPRVIYGVTIQGGHNFIRASGVQLGDLAVVSIRDDRGMSKAVPAIVVDSGGVNFPAMGTIALNAALKGATGPFEDRRSVLALSINDPKVVKIVIVPGSFGYELKRPYSNENIAGRWEKFLRQANFASTDRLIADLTSCADEAVIPSEPVASAFATRRKVPARYKRK